MTGTAKRWKSCPSELGFRTNPGGVAGSEGLAAGRERHTGIGSFVPELLQCLAEEPFHPIPIPTRLTRGCRPRSTS